MTIDIKKLKELTDNLATKSEIINYFDGDKESLEKACKKEYNLTFKNAYLKLIASRKIELKRELLNIATNNEAKATKNQLLALMFIAKSVLGFNDNNGVNANNMSSFDNSKNEDEGLFSD